MSRLVIVIVSAFVIGTAIGFAVLVGYGSRAPQTTSSGTALIGGPFSLTDQNGNRVTEKDFRGKHMLVFFGFTHCPDICPAELQVMASALEQLGGKASEVVPVFVTVDPSRDDPAALKAYLSNFGENFVGLTGSEQEIAAMAKEYKVAYSVNKEQASADNYNVDHTAIVYFMGPDGKFLEHFSYGTQADQMTATMKRYL